MKCQCTSNACFSFMNVLPILISNLFCSTYSLKTRIDMAFLEDILFRLSSFRDGKAKLCNFYIFLWSEYSQDTTDGINPEHGAHMLNVERKERIVPLMRSFLSYAKRFCGVRVSLKEFAAVPKARNKCVTEMKRDYIPTPCYDIYTSEESRIMIRRSSRRTCREHH